MSHTGPDATGLRIVVVDDYPHAAEMLARYLVRRGHDVQAATDADEALRLADDFLPHVMFIDIALPKLDGNELAKLVRSRPWGDQVLLVAVTGLGSQEEEQKSRRCGFDLHVRKPVSPEKLAALLATSLRDTDNQA
jgi:DNA-binding response OmpR family regulator